MQRAAFRCLYQLFRRDPSNGTITSKKTRAQLRRFVVTLHKLRPASSDPATVELWLKALTEAHVRAAKGGATSVDELGETLEICIKLSACRSKRLGIISSVFKLIVFRRARTPILSSASFAPRGRRGAINFSYGGGAITYIRKESTNGVKMLSEQTLFFMKNYAGPHTRAKNVGPS